MLCLEFDTLELLHPRDLTLAAGGLGGEDEVLLVAGALDTDEHVVRPCLRGSTSTAYARLWVRNEAPYRPRILFLYVVYEHLCICMVNL